METFVIRVWRDANRDWQGKVIHLPEQEACFFTTWPDAVAFMQHMTGWFANTASHTNEDTGPPGREL